MSKKTRKHELQKGTLMKKVWILLLLTTIFIICFIYFTRQPSRHRVEVLINGNGKITKESAKIIRDLQSLRVKSKDSPFVEFHVGVLIDTDDKIIKKSIESYIIRELRSLPDVKIEPVNPFDKIEFETDIISYSLRVKASQEKYKTGVKTGRIVLAAVYAQKMSQKQVTNKRLRALIEDSTPIYEPPIKSHLSKVFPKEILYENIYGAYLSDFNTKELPDICKKIVTQFDKQVLEKDREER